MRSLDANLVAALSQNKVFMAVLAEFQFESGTQYFWSGPEGHSIEWDGKTWTSIADLGRIDKISQAQGLADSRSVVSLRVNSDRVEDIGSDDSRGNAAIIELLFLTEGAASVGSIKFPKTMGEIRVLANATQGEDGKRLIDELVQMELLDETSTLNKSMIQRVTYEAGLRIDSEDHGLEFAADPTAGDLGIVYDGRNVPPPADDFSFRE